MRHLTRTVLLAGLLTCAAGVTYAAEGKDDGSVAGRKDGASTTSMGAGGLTGTGATRDGARMGTEKTQTGGAKPPSAPAAGTTR
ncbi:hypothetical protein SAMN05216360_12439 [Methylobacterium phyllostachyos]|uniref:Uncharacterized protein n=1 Tax=Methylobacterium phyllostachyos TaxID=582672 RepID=A0A1H0K0C5_9HYPH|nr:hypothetical protein [Methylobacterium phyllostachyos]SDO49406.1 hypothetical protein SAMN05216360_12439 [Methylobacterium phyllostachyos]